MVKCSCTEDIKIPWSELPKPIWWPSKLPFRVPSAKHVMVSLILCLENIYSNLFIFQRKIVERCYAFHGCDYLLHFCKNLVETKPKEGYKFTDNRDGTSSMYDGHSGKLLVTFRNENRVRFAEIIN